MLNITDEKIREILTYIANAETKFDIIKNKNINYYYKFADILTYKYIVKAATPKGCTSRPIPPKELDEIKQDIEKNLDLANNLEANTLMVLCRRRAFFELIGDKGKAKNINYFIKKVDRENGQYWEKLI